MISANVGTIDRGIRAIVGIALVATPILNQGFVEQGPMTWLTVGAGVVLIATSTIKICPIYKVFGFRTCKS